LQNAVEFSQISINPCAVVCNSCSKAAWELAFLKPPRIICTLPRVGILKQNAKSWYSGIPGFEVRRNSKKIVLPNYFLNMT
jgi:hypothetical protein